MTQPPAPPPPQFAPPPGPIMQGPKPWSALAISAFVCSLLGFLGVTAALGLILGIAGIIVTSGGKRRGLGLAIAAIPISLVMGAVFGLIMLGIALAGKFVVVAASIMPVFEAKANARAEAMTAFRENTSQDFDDNVTDEQFFSWMDNVESDQGSLMQITTDFGAGSQPRTTTDSQGRVTISLPAKFVNGTSTVQIRLKSEGMWNLVIDDVSVGGVSPRDVPKAGAPPDSKEQDGE